MYEQPELPVTGNRVVSVAPSFCPKAKTVSFAAVVVMLPVDCNVPVDVP